MLETLNQYETQWSCCSNPSHHLCLTLFLVPTLFLSFFNRPHLSSFPFSWNTLSFTQTCILLSVLISCTNSILEFFLLIPLVPLNPTQSYLGSFTSCLVLPFPFNPSFTIASGAYLVPHASTVLNGGWHTLWLFQGPSKKECQSCNSQRMLNLYLQSCFLRCSLVLENSPP